ncbi:MAG: 50S ribosomal protein L29 [Bacteroidetes bacterium]|nr:MAG: 50S ribosomal protein L29 [Bacteroidota bacterium]REK05135.1 MAG: 50S ribosomal protein L29 [Bacteroidota bacterium]REK32540.1 MAG: 50S ribosomal protein L29 [Bacteroidota bacterium]REK49013.1 MAG: 50S ribosomal protein L29 [Bacteroidota bacterium]
MKKEDIKELTTDELKLRLAEEKNLYVKMKMNHAVSPIENPMKIRATRRGIAMLHTELTKRAKADQKNK